MLTFRQSQRAYKAINFAAIATPLLLAAVILQTGCTTTRGTEATTAVDPTPQAEIADAEPRGMQQEDAIRNEPDSTGARTTELPRKSTDGIVWGDADIAPLESQRIRALKRELQPKIDALRNSTDLERSRKEYYGEYTRILWVVDQHQSSSAWGEDPLIVIEDVPPPSEAARLEFNQWAKEQHEALMREREAMEARLATLRQEALLEEQNNLARERAQIDYHLGVMAIQEQQRQTEAIRRQTDAINQLEWQLRGSTR
jgi:hypothetical protein